MTATLNGRVNGYVEQAPTYDAVREQEAALAQRYREHLQRELRPVLAAVSLRAEAEAERADLVATGGLHQAESVLNATDGRNVASFLDHQAEAGHPYATTFVEVPEQPVTPEAPRNGLWNLVPGNATRTARRTAAEAATIEPVRSTRGYVIGVTADEPGHWVQGMELPELAVVTVDGDIGQVPSRVSKDGRIVPVTTVMPEPLRIGRDGRPAEPVMGAHTHLVNLADEGQAPVWGAGFAAPEHVTQLLQGLAAGGRPQLDHTTVNA
ncbi:MAG TPA: hypothetical protein VLF69_06405 [Candidatus Saccharimonadales bacterium]|nr:hypothetical protein [Candidatus Saccharimonadales bacterium]